MVRLLGEGGRPYMPLGDAQLSDAELAAVESWIANGAPQ
jgi:mono/diheme cytochrome c family protein